MQLVILVVAIQDYYQRGVPSYYVGEMPSDFPGPLLTAVRSPPPADTQIHKGRTTWRNLPSIFLIPHDFDYLSRFFSVSKKAAAMKLKAPF